VVKLQEERWGVRYYTRAVFYSCRIQNAILVSGAFQCHIKLLVSWKYLTMPSDIDQNLYYEFSQSMDIPWQISRRTGTGVPETEGSDSEDRTNNCDRDLEKDQDPFAVFHDGGITMAIQGWVKLFVQHLHAKNILESFARHGGREIPIEIKVYGVSSPMNHPLPTVDNFDTVIRSSLKDVSAERRDEMTKVFWNHFRDTDDNTATARTSDGVSSGRNNIYRVIRNIMKEKTTTSYYTIHCEAALAGLVAASKFPHITDFADEELLAELHVGL
jgi:hypothetical protein